jgi:AcrR family transcriptional regulator
MRADAVRNVERILRAARAVYAETGPDAQLEEIAQQAGVTIRTLFRRFPTKADLVRAALEHGIAEVLTPVVERALTDDDPLRGLVTVIEASLALATSEYNLLAAARGAGTLTADASAEFYESMTQLAQRAQDAGLLRADLVPDDLPRIMGMLVSTIWSMPPDSEGWRRYLALVLDGMSPTAGRHLPPALKHDRISPTAHALA